VKDIGLDASDEKLKEYVWNMLKSGQVKSSKYLPTKVETCLI
jgi:hypothetical protein